MKIHCYTIELFVSVIAGLAREGVGFEANADTFTIKLTGAC